MSTQTTVNPHEARLMQILIKPHVSEKTNTVAEAHRQFVFKVHLNATKPEIKRAVELMFSVEVKNVRVCNRRGKARRFKQMDGWRKGCKIAYVGLKEGHDINFGATK